MEIVGVMFKIKLDTTEFAGKIVSEGIQESPIDGYKIVDGMVARQSIPNGQNIKPLANKLNSKYGVFNKYFELIRIKNNNAVLSILRYCAKSDTLSNAELSESVVSPIKKAIKNKYFGSNRRNTIKNKGFDRLMLDTAAFYKSIILKIIK